MEWYPQEVIWGKNWGPSEGHGLPSEQGQGVSSTKGRQRMWDSCRETGTYSEEKVKCFYSVTFISPHSYAMNYEALRATCHQVAMFNRKRNMQREQSMRVSDAGQKE